MAVVEVFADIICPFTHVGLLRFVEQRAELGRHDVTLHVRSWPLEVVNGQPHDGRFLMEEIDEIRRQAAPTMFEGVREASFPSSSLPALVLAAAAYERDVTVGEEVSLELRRLLFEEGVDVGDDRVLRGLADRHGIDVDLGDTRRVMEDHAEGRERGVIGSPHFFTADGGFFCPALEVGRDEEGHLVVRPDPARFDRFVSSCFS